MQARNVLPALILALFPACDDKSQGALDDDGAEPSNEEEEVADFSREGEDCDGSVVMAECQVDGVAGDEFCVWSEVDYTWTWTACLTVTCEVEGASRACKDGGVSYCAAFNLGDQDGDNVNDGDELRWGVCGEVNECEAGQTQECPGSEDFGGITMGCTTDPNGRGIWRWEDCNTPLVLSFDGALEFTPAPIHAAAFDIHGGAGTCVRADWPAAATPWLALDRDGDGQITGGQELFGSATRMSAGTGPHNGFQALAELDSDGDRRITPADARWAELVLWADHDADRRSSGWELLPLTSFEVVAIELDFAIRGACDEAGNCGRERASFVYRTDGREQVGDVIDVRVACE